MLIALFPNAAKDRSIETAIGIKEFLTEAKVDVICEDSLAPVIHAASLSSVDGSTIDFLISIGGDGTILQLFHSYPELKAPVVGVNLGGLGFLADIPLENLYPSLQELIDGAYKVDKRIFIKGDLAESQSSFAINDIVIHRAQNRSIIDLAIHVDGNYVNTFAADGLIFATPSGSTAYSLASGGPILTPELEALVLTPISPHTISNRPIVLMPKHEIQVQYLSRSAPIEVVFDGIECFSLKTGDILKISKAPHHFSLVNLERNDYFATLRTKLDWRGRLRH